MEKDIEKDNLSLEQIDILESRLAEEESEYLTIEESLKKLLEKFNL